MDREKGIFGFPAKEFPKSCFRSVLLNQFHVEGPEKASASDLAVLGREVGILSLYRPIVGIFHYIWMSVSDSEFALSLHVSASSSTSGCDESSQPIHWEAVIPGGGQESLFDSDSSVGHSVASGESKKSGQERQSKSAVTKGSRSIV
ncbi:hypothetical protein Cni_G13160 [Canna indica]|uniref:Uncharacterized protein n=1 Tax=Canna indica TaxID=4628 RepID=A0AAQ3QB93_9LILI|nr:hypothetical protein Cni_G13160 [Canna indica]